MNYWIQGIQTFGIPIAAMLIPIVYTAYIISRNPESLYLPKTVVKKFGILFLIFFFGSLSLLMTLTGSIARYFYLVPGLYFTADSVRINFTQNWSLFVRYYPGLYFVVISLFIGVIYSSFFSLPTKCSIKTIEDGAKGEILSSSTASIGATVSASASLVSCCTPSIAALLSPVVASFLGPYVPSLLIFSLILMLYSFKQVVIQRIDLRS